MKLWKITNSVDGRVVYAMATRWFDVRTFGSTYLKTNGDFSTLEIAPCSPFVESEDSKKSRKLPKGVKAFRLYYTGSAAGANDLKLHTKRCKTVEELYTKAEDENG